jgi:tetratricopeptide (TPR) repeat protein
MRVSACDRAMSSAATKARRAAGGRDAIPDRRRDAPAQWHPSLRKLALAACAALLLAAATRADAQAPAYVGTAACAGCHAKEHEAWRGSHHDRAMEEANEKTVLGNFADARFTQGGVTTRFFRRDGRYFVSTDGPDGKLADFEVRYTFGVYPLQQYLIELPGGRLQAFGVAWDARPKAQGGQRWFHLYPGRKLKAGDALHWTGIDQTWNYQCADCHSTNLRKNYDEASRTYRTTWSEIDVGCEACHGPGSAHLAWAKQDANARRGDAAKGLAVALDERRGVSWPIDAGTGNARRSTPRTASREIETCARCHARRGQFDDSWHPGAPLGNAYRVATLEPGLYYADGQMREEVYNHGSFLQSRMHAKGVTCSDCHDPHSQKLRAPGNAVCGQCHAPSRFDVEAHHRHRPGSPGAACVSCHMPTTTYMVVDPRHDHSMRIPRPDRTAALGTPNACGSCHAKQGAKWAAEAVARWYPQRNLGFQSFAEVLAAGDRGAPGAQAALAALASDATAPPIARASAIPRLVRHPGRATLPALERALADGDSLVRLSAASALRDADPALRARLLPRLLGDPVRVVRIEAARGLVGVPESRLSSEDRARLAKAQEEFLASLRFNADRPEALTDLGGYYAARGQEEQAIAAYRRAIALDPTFVPAAANLADLHRARGREPEAQAVLRQAIKADPSAAGAHHALGLALVRQKRVPEALAALGQAARLAPEDARFAYVYGVALHDAGRRADATRTLEAALARHPYDREILFALASYEREAGNVAKAAQRAKLLAELEPDNPDIAQFARDLQSARPAAR